MTALYILLALSSLMFFVSCGPLLPRQECVAGTTTNGNGQTLTCGGDGRYYDGNGQPVAPSPIISVVQPSQQGCAQGTTTFDANGQTLTCGGDGRYYDVNGQPAQPSQINTVVQPSQQGCAQGTTTSDANGRTLTCGGDGRYYDTNGQPVTQNGQSQNSQDQNSQNVNSQNQNGQSETAQQSPSTVPHSGSGGAPEGYSVGYSTQDYERPGQKSGCSTYCSANSFIFANNQIGPGGALAAAINPAMLGGDVCATCGICFNIINAGIAALDGPGGPSPQPAANQQIKVWIVNSCTNCAMNQFDINDCPAGWDNPKIYYQQIPC